jgi:hypothetical protein
MPYIAINPAKYKGQAVGSGQCVAFVHVASGAPNTAKWKQGISVKGAAIVAGTAIATFDPGGIYGNHIDGRSHAAIYVGQDALGLQVWDQWVGQPVHERTIHFNPNNKPVNDGNKFYVID